MANMLLLSSRSKLVRKKSDKTGGKKNVDLIDIQKSCEMIVYEILYSGLAKIGKAFNTAENEQGPPLDQ